MLNIKYKKGGYKETPSPPSQIGFRIYLIWIQKFIDIISVSENSLVKNEILIFNEDFIISEKVKILNNNHNNNGYETKVNEIIN